MDMIQPQTWTDFCQIRWSKRERLDSNLGKIEIEEFLDKNEFPYSKILRKFEDPLAISLDGLPVFFVIKPAALWSARGVMLIKRVQENYYRNDMDGEYYTEHSIKQKLLSLQKSVNKKKLDILIEERAVDENELNLIPFDYKLFTFNGNVKFILQVDRNHKKPKLAFFDGDFTPIYDGRAYIKSKNKNELGVPRRPECYQELILLASKISTKLDAPFISIDCYATKEGPVFGELTHTPGGPWFGSMYMFSDDFDKELGDAWREAAIALNKEIPLVESQYDILFRGKVVRTVGKQRLDKFNFET
ncbi:ATP-grasp fold amidoligase family protein [Salinicola halophyticus]|uniref:ATP-grasp fold amidoligase family protein n=1 Tax=Salinicola halophyticus TaxID=1808881 RepID=UPI003F473142